MNPSDGRPKPDLEFDEYANRYDELLADPIRDRFGGEPLFFHQRKLDVLLSYLRKISRNPGQLVLLDLGCGRGDLLRLAGPHFSEVHGCDVSAESLKYCEGIGVQVQNPPETIPFPDGTFDLITAACVFHHVEPDKRPLLISAMARALKPGGMICIFEHNPWNPVTRIIVNRSPIDVNAILLSSRECKKLLTQGGLTVKAVQYYLFFPQSVHWGTAIEPQLVRLPLGGQYAVFGTLERSQPRG